MASLDDDAICLRQWDWSETSQTVLLFGRERGLIKGLAKGSRRPKARFDGGIEPLTRGSVSAIGKPGAGLLTLTAWDLAEPYAGLRRSYDAFLAASVAADVARRLFELLDPHPAAFDAMATALGGLDEMGDVPARAAGLLGPVLAVLLKESGNFPELEHDVRTQEPIEAEGVMLFDPALGGLVADGDREGRWPMRAATVAALRDPDGEAGDDGGWVRAVRFLLAWVRYRTGEDVPSASMLLGRPEFGGRGARNPAG